MDAGDLGGAWKLQMSCRVIVYPELERKRRPKQIIHSYLLAEKSDDSKASGKMTLNSNLGGERAGDHDILYGGHWGEGPSERGAGGRQRA